MLAVRLVILLAKAPAPLPLLVLVDKAIVGFIDVLQHTPRAVTAASPSLLMSPPLAAVVAVMDVAAVVVSVDKPAILFSFDTFWQLNVMNNNRVRQ